MSEFGRGGREGQPSNGRPRRDGQGSHFTKGAGSGNSGGSAGSQGGRSSRDDRQRRDRRSDNQYGSSSRDGERRTGRPNEGRNGASQGRGTSGGDERRGSSRSFDGDRRGGRPEGQGRTSGGRDSRGYQGNSRVNDRTSDAGRRPERRDDRGTSRYDDRRGGGRDDRSAGFRSDSRSGNRSDNRGGRPQGNSAGRQGNKPDFRSGGRPTTGRGQGGSDRQDNRDRYPRQEHRDDRYAHRSNDRDNRSRDNSVGARDSRNSAPRTGRQEHGKSPQRNEGRFERGGTGKPVRNHRDNRSGSADRRTDRNFAAYSEQAGGYQDRPERSDNRDRSRDTNFRNNDSRNSDSRSNRSGFKGSGFKDGGGSRNDRRPTSSQGDRSQGDRRDRTSSSSSRGTYSRGKDDRTQQPRERDTRDRRPSPHRNERPFSRANQAMDDDSLAKELLTAPELPEGIEFSDLDQELRGELRTLPKVLAEVVGKHLIAANALMEEDPAAAIEHAKYAKSKASRVPIVREALGLISYHAGEWAEALTELRAVRRMTRSDIHVAVIADSERALGRPERALDLIKEVNKGALPQEIAVELDIVAAGARRDLGQADAAVVSLQGSELNENKREPWSARLFYAYADNLEAAGRKKEAIEWFMHAAEADVDDETDAADRATILSDQ